MMGCLRRAHIRNMDWIGLCVVLLVLIAPPAPAQTDPTITAQRASAMLEAAGEALLLAEGARDRVTALSETIRAFEEGLAATREALRRSAAREAALTTQLTADHDRLSALLAAAQAIERAPAPLLLLHPDGPEGAARSSMMLAEVTPGVAAQAAGLRRQLSELQAMRDLQDAARRDLTAALEDAQRARAELSDAIAERVELPPRVETDPERMGAILSAATTLDALATALSDAPLGPLPETQRIDAARGELDLPVFGNLLRGFGAADAAGVTRPGLILATRAQALVTAPWAGTVRYAGLLPNEDMVVLLEPDASHMIILAGLGETFVSTGEIVQRGAPLGLMGQDTATSEDLMPVGSEDTGLSLPETLYIELRVNDAPVDPADWFRATRN